MSTYEHRARRRWAGWTIEAGDGLRPGGAMRAGAIARLVVLLATLLVGCSGGPTAPTASPTAAATPATTAAEVTTPGDGPTATPMPTARTPTPMPTAIIPKTPVATAPPSPAATDIVLQMRHTGGFLPPGMAPDIAPAFTLYGDGTVIYRPGNVPLVGPAGRAGGLRQATMNREQMDALLAFALGAGGLAEAEERYDDVDVADSLTTTFEIDGLGVDKTVAVYGLGDEPEPGPETPHRERFKALADLLDSFDEQVARGNATDVGDYEPELYRVTIIADEFAEFAPSGEWPWNELEPDDFEPDQSGFGFRLLSVEEAEPLFALAPAEIGDPIVVGPDGVNYIVRYRPLLPDEVPTGGRFVRLA